MAAIDIRSPFPDVRSLASQVNSACRGDRGPQDPRRAADPGSVLVARWLMLAVAVVGISLVLIGRRSRALSLAEHHYSEIAEPGWACSRSSWFRFYMDGEGRTFIAEPLKKNEWHRNMYSKYRRAASYPWLPIESDPPEPDWRIVSTIWCIRQDA